MIRKFVALGALGFAMLLGLLTMVAFTPTTSPGSVGASGLMALAAINAKEGQGDLTCGPVGSAGAGAVVAAQAAKRAGWTGNDLVLAVAIAGAESTWKPDATNANTNGSTDYGLWQVNSVHATILASGDWKDPYDNARMAHQVWADAKGWTPWVTFNEGRHVQHLATARAAVQDKALDEIQPCTGDPVGKAEGNLTGATVAMRRAVTAQFPGLVIGCYRAAEDGGEHPRGRACDVMVPVDSPTGDSVALWTQRNAVRLHIKYLIWRQAIWSPERADEDWRPMADRGSITQNHRDHVHISVNCVGGEPVWAGC